MGLENGDTVGLTMRQLVLEIRQDVKDLDIKVDHIDRYGSIGTKPELADHETRIRSLEIWRYGIPSAILISMGTSTAIILRALGV